MTDHATPLEAELERTLREMDSVDSMGAHALTVRKWVRILKAWREETRNATATAPTLTVQTPEVLATLEREGWDLVCLRRPRFVHDPTQAEPVEVQAGWWEVLAPAETGHRPRTMGCGNSVEQAVQSALSGLFAAPMEDDSLYDEDPLAELAEPQAPERS